LTIRIFGDMMMHSQQISTALESDGSYNFGSYFTHIQKYLDKSDLNVVNMEFTLAGTPYSGYPAFSAPDEYANHIAKCGFNIFLAANNHICDKYSAGMIRTLNVYRELEQSHGIHFTGAAADEEELDRTTPLVVEHKGIKIAFINATYGTNLACEKKWPQTNYLNNREKLARDLEKAEEQADITIVMPHWGEEYVLHHSTKQKATAQWLIEHGADIIIGSHPHVVQDKETIEWNQSQVPVVYSLGNLVSNMSAANTQIGLMATIKIVKSLNNKCRILPIDFTYLWSSRPEGYCNSYTILPVKDFIESSDGWVGEWEYEKMKTTYNRVKEKTGIKEN
jgi:poly-gamma-glutamate synthesis protein (capsule biosynthesis protein)